MLSYRQWKCSGFIASVRRLFSKSQLKVYVPTIDQQRSCIEHWLWSWPLLYTVQWARWRAICFDERLETDIRFTPVFFITVDFIQIKAIEQSTELGYGMDDGFVLHHSLMLTLKGVLLYGFCVFKHITTYSSQLVLDYNLPIILIMLMIVFYLNYVRQWSTTLLILLVSHVTQ